ncbi:hypothetical protein SO694_00133024 [Aureococcus anophagefferens]|uniref:J domain-containing protein n=1 Tax=Aureococcus anophagefferens TaxID=44056 RepID=A0ABR1GG60_AURAN|nr:hypothetical protein JL722_8174 [Aureococcus anophagefferens]
MWHTAATRPAVQRMYFDECEEMWRPYRPKPSRSRALRRPTLHRSASRVLSAHVLPPPRDDALLHARALGVPRDCVDADELRRAYHRLSRRTHPDRGGDADAFARVSAAYDWLGDRARRARYATSNGAYGAHARPRPLPLEDG